jgi:hypothetical protein
MPRKPQLLISAAFLCLLIAASVNPAFSQGRGRQANLPDGPGKDLVQMQCTKCHALGLIANAGGNTRQEWVDLFTTMPSCRMISVTRSPIIWRRVSHLSPDLSRSLFQAR